MGIRILVTVAVVVLGSSVAWAQDGLRSASLPERTIARPLPSAVRDLFRADPDTYTYVHPGRRELHRHRDRSRHLWVPIFFPWGYIDGPWTLVGRALSGSPGGPDKARPTDDTTRQSDPARPTETPAREWTLPKPLGPGAAKTFYVIPGCYAGDKPPRPDQLRSGCEASKIVQIPPAG